MTDKAPGHRVDPEKPEWKGSGAGKRSLPLHINETKSESQELSMSELLTIHAHHPASTDTRSVNRSITLSKSTSHL